MKKRKVLNVIHHNGECIAQLYDTVIFIGKEGEIKLNSGGWRTNHTKNCINDLLPKGYKLYQKSFEWFIKTPFETLKFEDGITIRG